MVRQQGVYKKIPLQYISQNLEPSKIKIEGLRIWLSNNFLSDSFEPSFSVFRGNIVVNKPKSRISKHVFQENKARQIFQKTNTHTCTYQGVRNVRFFWKFGVLYFLETIVLRFALLSYYQRYFRDVPKFSQKFWKVILVGSNLLKLNVVATSVFLKNFLKFSGWSFIR